MQLDSRLTLNLRHAYNLERAVRRAAGDDGAKPGCKTDVTASFVASLVLSDDVSVIVLGHDAQNRPFSIVKLS